MTSFSPRHHVADDVLLEYAAACLPAATRLVVSCHLTLCPLCRAKLERLDDVGGACLAEGPEAALAPNGLAALLDRLDEAGEGGASLERKLARGREPQPASNPHALPRPLLACLPGERLRWRRWLPGVKGVTLDLGDDRATARLVHFGPGVSVPLHDHERAEYVLVLDGHLHEGDADYLRGDIAVSEPGHAHVQTVDAASPCVALIVNEGRLLPKTAWGRVLTWVTGV